MSRSLSKKESEVVLELEWENKQFATITDVASMLNCSYEYAKKICQRLVEKKWFESIGKGKYLLISASTGKEGIPSTNALLAGSLLVKPYYFSYSTSNAFYGFSTQIPSTVYIATTRSKSVMKRVNTLYRFVTLSERKFFGFEKVRVFNIEVLMAKKEKTIIDSIDKIWYAGGLQEVVGVLKDGVKKVDLSILIEYAMKMKSSALIQRLGFLLEHLDIHFDEQLFLKHIRKGIIYLDPCSGKKGTFCKKWQIIRNVSEDVYD